MMLCPFSRLCCYSAAMLISKLVCIVSLLLVRTGSLSTADAKDGGHSISVGSMVSATFLPREIDKRRRCQGTTVPGLFGTLPWLFPSFCVLTLLLKGSGDLPLFVKWPIDCLEMSRMTICLSCEMSLLYPWGGVPWGIRELENNGGWSCWPGAAFALQISSYELGVAYGTLLGVPPRRVCSGCWDRLPVCRSPAQSVGSMTPFRVSLFC